MCNKIVIFDDYGIPRKLKNEQEVKALINIEIQRQYVASIGDNEDFWRKITDGKSVKFLSDEFRSDIRKAIENEEDISIAVWLDKPIQGVKQLLIHVFAPGRFSEYIFTEAVLAKLNKSYILYSDIKDEFCYEGMNYLIVGDNLLIGYEDDGLMMCFCDCIVCPSIVYGIMQDILSNALHIFDF